MKILHINDYKNGGGAEVICNITYKLMGGKIVYLENLIGANKFSRLFNQFLFNPFLYFKLKKIINTYKPDIIHLHNYNLAPLTVLLAVKKYKTIQTVHASGQICPSSWGVYRKNYKKCNLKPEIKKCFKNCFFDKPKFLGIIYYFWHRFISFLRKKYIKGFIFPSVALKKGFEKNGFKNLVVIRNPLPFEVKQIENPPFYIKENIILYVGKLIKLKGVNLLVKQLKEIDLQGRKFIFIGDGPLRNFLINYTKDDDRFFFIGKVKYNQIKNFYKKSKILIIPSVGFDNFPTTILEGLIFNNIVLGSNKGGIPEILDKKLIFDTEKGSINSLKLKLLDVVKNINEYFKISQKCKKNILKFSKYEYKKNLLKFYKLILNSNDE